MSALNDLLAAHTALTQDDADHLQSLVSEWQLLADLSFADLVLWVPTTGGDYLCVAQVRPTTGPTAYQRDLVETTADDEYLARLRAPHAPETFAVRRRGADAPIAVMTRRRHQAAAAATTPESKASEKEVTSFLPWGFTHMLLAPIVCISTRT